MFVRDHLSSPALLAWCAAHIPGFRASAWSALRPAPPARAGDRDLPRIIDRVRRGVQPFAR